jgi:hypothetical protein
MPKGTCFADGRDVQATLQEQLGAPVDAAEILNHHGLLSLKIRVGETIYKVAECESQGRASLAEKALLAASRVNGPVPGFIGRTGSVIICTWIFGASCKNDSRHSQSRHALDCQESLYRTPLPDHSGGFCSYIHLDSLLARFYNVAPRVVPLQRINAIITSLQNRLPHPGTPRVIHPDLTPSNIIITENNAPFIIDNEVIAIGAGFEFDIWNTAEAIYGHRDGKGMEQYVRQFHERCPNVTLFDYRSTWDDFRYLRRAMKAIEKRRPIKARRLIGMIDA